MHERSILLKNVNGKLYLTYMWIQFYCPPLVRDDPNSALPKIEFIRNHLRLDEHPWVREVAIHKREILAQYGWTPEAIQQAYA